MKDFQTIDDTIRLKKIWPAIIEHGSLQIQEAIDPHKNLLERVFNGCWLEIKNYNGSMTSRYTLKNGRTMKSFSSYPDKELEAEAEADWSCYVFFAELVLRERYRKNGVLERPGEYVRGPELEKIMNRLN